MTAIEALILGLIQGLTEFLPISSSGHIELGKALLRIPLDENNDLTFTVVVHGATVLSTLVFFRKDLIRLVGGAFKLRWNEESRYLSNLAVSMIPVVIVGLLFKDQLEALVAGNIVLVGVMLLFTGGLLLLTRFVKRGTKDVNMPRAALIGISQAVAVLPGLSRSGTTIAVALLSGVSGEKATRFSFLMVLVPIIGANIKTILDGEWGGKTEWMPLSVGFVAAFVTGLLACKWMMAIVRTGKLTWFAAYCLIVGTIALFLA